MSQDSSVHSLLVRFEQFLDGFRSDSKTSALTHTSMCNIYKKKGSFAIPPEKEKMFLHFYNTIVFDHNHPLSMVERPLADKGILKFDLDFKYTSESLERTYSDHVLHKIVACLQGILLEYVEKNCENTLHSFVFQRNGPYRSKEKLVKDGIHIMYPNIYIEFSFHHFVRSRYIDELERMDLSSMIPFTNSLSDVVDECVIERNGWLMHGSTKENVSPYKLVAVFDENMDLVPISLSDKQLVTYLSIRQVHQHCSIVKPYTLEENKRKRKKPEVVSSPANFPSDKVKTPDRMVSAKKSTLYCKRYTEKLVGMLGTHRALDYSSWLEVGMCLHNIDADLFDLWVSFSKQNFDDIINHLQNKIQTLKSAETVVERYVEDTTDPRRNALFHCKESFVNTTSSSSSSSSSSSCPYRPSYQSLRRTEELDERIQTQCILESDDNMPELLCNNIQSNTFIVLQHEPNTHSQTTASQPESMHGKETANLQNMDNMYDGENSTEMQLRQLEIDAMDWEEIISSKKDLQKAAAYIQSTYCVDETKFLKLCKSKWDSFKTKQEGGLHFGSLCYWALKDSPNTFKSVRFSSLKSMILECVAAPSHAKIARILYKKYQYLYICSDYESVVWYEWKEHCWKRMDGVQTIRRKVNGCCNDSDSILSDFNKLKGIMMTERVENDKDIKELKLQVEQVEHQLKPKQAELAEFKRKYGDRATIPDLQDTVKNLLADLKEKKAAYEKHYKELKKIHVKPFEDTVIRFLETSSSIDNIIKEAKQEFYCRDFNRRMNENAALFLFNNGVFDLDAMVFRDGRPDDYITLESSEPQISYKEFHLESDATIVEIEDFFKKVIVDTEKREFFLTLVASCLEGYNINNIFPILTGSGSNSKSLTMSLIEDCFGAKYSGKLNSAFLTQKRNKSNSASPEYYAIADCRIVSSEESDMSDELNTAIIKEITGNSKIATRTLFQSKMTTKIPQFTPFLICNDLPIVKALDGGTWRRIVVVSFDSKFVDDPSDPQWASLSNVFQIDRNLKGKMKEWKEPFMYWLIHKYYKAYRDNSKNLVPPECVKAYTDKFKDENDKLQPFIESNIVSTGLKTDTLKIKELYQRVLSWHREHFMGEKEPPQLLVKKYFEQKFGCYDSRGWIGRKLVDL